MDERENMTGLWPTHRGFQGNAYCETSKGWYVADKNKAGTWYPCNVTAAGQAKLKELPESMYEAEHAPTEARAVDNGSKYLRPIKGNGGTTIEVDVYDVLRAFKVTDPAHAHGMKKVLCPGQRGEKDVIKDLQEGINSLQKYLVYLQQS